MPQTLEQFGATIKAKYPQYNDIPSAELGRKMITKYPQYSDLVDRYDAPQTRQTKLGNLKAAASKAEAESKKANSVGGYLGQLGSDIASSEVGLGNSLQKIFGNQRDKFGSAENTLTESQVAAAKKIREMEASGKDATKLKRLYNENANQLEGVTKDLNQESSLPSTEQVAGQLGGTALDLLSAGSYGKATAGMKSGVLQSVSPAKTAVGNVLTKSPGLFTKEGGSKVLAGGTLGYGYDVSRGLQGNRGEDRTGAGAFIPGLGTAVGAGVPAVLGGIQTVKNIASGSKTPEGTVKLIKGSEDTMSKKEIIDAIDQGRVRTTKLGAKDYLPSEADKRAATILQGKLKGNPVQNVPIVKKEIATRGAEAERFLEQNKKPITAQEQATVFNKLRADAEKVLTPSELRVYDQQVKLFSKQLVGRGGFNTETFYKALKEYEANVAEKLPRGRAALLDPTGVANAKLHAASDISGLVRDLISSKHPEFKPRMFDLAALYQAKSNLLAKAYNLQGNAISRIIEHPGVKTAALITGGLTLLGGLGTAVKAATDGK